MTANIASNYTNLSSLNGEFLSFNDTTQTPNITVQNAIQAWLTAPSQTTYDPMKTAIFNAQTTLAVGRNDTLRALLAMSDGTVAIDTSKAQTTNSYTNFTNKAVNSDNHNTRPEMMVAILGSNGSAITDRYSTTVSTTQKYLATRLGAGTNTNFGTWRVSLNDTLVV